ncbi:uncharacterized protein N7511_007814 [Penicillium nucicola]|uniref:uncharacterized protein n=1 Tax=Penicillium nucicola TaxID=1850975 RepID=UPI00254540F0|nr:uncharacterized protein N7511_007814 [Penicillium nucicola]KAJ5753661.1 hypothetical protein N7511_007814 [Penicillium nucicola]
MALQVPVAAYEGEKYFCKFKPRIHRDAHLADSGSWECQIDLLNSQGAIHNDWVRNGRNKSYAVGCINPTVGNFMALAATAAIPDRLALVSYILEYAFVHDDIIDYAESQSESQLREVNSQLVEGLNDDQNERPDQRNVKMQLQAKMAQGLLKFDKTQGNNILKLWKEMSDIFLEIRDIQFKDLTEYLSFREIDAGCPWTMRLVSFSMDFYLTNEEEESISAITKAAYDSWCLVNDYFSWEKELLNNKVSGSTGQITNAVFLLAKWHAVDVVRAREMVRDEIIAREELFCKLKSEYIAYGRGTDRILRWFEVLDDVTAANFAWSMTTARYDAEAEDAYPGLRAVGGGSK